MRNRKKEAKRGEKEREHQIIPHRRGHMVGRTNCIQKNTPKRLYYEIWSGKRQQAMFGKRIDVEVGRKENSTDEENR